MDLALHEHQHGETVVLAVGGEVDLATVPRLRDRIVRLATRGLDRLVVDLGGVVLLDSVGLGVLLGARARVEALGASFVVVCPPGPARDLVERLGLIEVLPVVDDVEAALAERGGTRGRT